MVENARPNYGCNHGCPCLLMVSTQSSRVHTCSNPPQLIFVPTRPRSTPPTTPFAESTLRTSPARQLPLCTPAQTTFATSPTATHLSTTPPVTTLCSPSPTNAPSPTSGSSTKNKCPSTPLASAYSHHASANA